MNGQGGLTQVDLQFNSISRVKKNFTISLMGKIKNGQKLKMAENRDAKSGRCSRYICAIFFSWC